MDELLILFRHLHGTDEQFQKWRCPIFKNMVITVSGLDSEKRKQVKALVEAEGETKLAHHFLGEHNSSV